METEQELYEKKTSIMGFILSVLLAVIIFAVGAALCVLVYVRGFMGQLDNASGAMQQVVEGVDLAQLDVSAITGKEQTLSEYVYDNLTENIKADMDVEDVEALLSEAFITEFISDKLGDYSKAMLEGTGEGKITAKEVIELLDENKAAIEEAAGVDIDTYIYDIAIENFFEENDIEEKTNISNISVVTAEDKETAVNVTSVINGLEYAISYKALAAAAGIIIVLALLIFLLNRCTSVVFSYIGVICLVLALVNGGVFITVPYVAEIVSKASGLDISICKAMFSSIKMQGLIIGARCLVAGTAFIAVRKIAKSRANG